MSTVAPSPTDQVLAAAQAALRLLPIPAGAVVAAAAPADLPHEWSGVLRRFTGARGGSTGLLLDPAAAASLTAALAQASADEGPADAPAGETSQLLAACVPALDAMAEALGPVAVLDALATTGEALVAALVGAPAAAVAAVTVDGEPQAYIVLLLDPSDPAPTVPEPRGTPGTRPAGDDPAAAARGMDLLRSVPMEVTAEIGRTRMTISELLTLSPGTVVELDRPVGSPADVLVNGRLFARGEVVVVDEDFAIRITEIVDAAAEPGAP